MNDPWLVVLMAAAVLVSMVLLAVVCLHCRNKRPQAYIRQADPSGESTELRMLHPSQPTLDRSSIHPPSNLLSPYLQSVDPGSQRRQRSFTPTDTESNPSYENPTDEADLNPESDAEDTGYIIVLPEVEPQQTNQSRASTPSSDVQHDYVNVEVTDEKINNSHLHCYVSSDDKDYLNVKPLCCQMSTPELSAQSDSDDDDDDDEGNYVNVQDGLQTA